MARDERRKSAKTKPEYDYEKLPDKIPDTPENIMRALCNTPPKKDREWEYLKTEAQPTS